MNSIKILLVEDEPSLNEVIALNLTAQGYEVTSAFDGSEALKKVKENLFHLVVLDVMLPNKDGFDVCREIRKTNTDMQIIIVSAKDSTEDKIQGLKLGADDYLPKPFDLEELLLRVKSLLKRNSLLQAQLSSYDFGTNKINFSTYIAMTAGDPVQLTFREAKLLELLINKENEVVSRDEILQQVWGYGDAIPNTRTIDNFILNFRKYFEDNPKQPRHFHSVWGVGYKFTKQKS